MSIVYYIRGRCMPHGEGPGLGGGGGADGSQSSILCQSSQFRERKSSTSLGINIDLRFASDMIVGAK